MTLKEQTISGILWSFVDNFLTQSITFVVGVILARLLTPSEFGLIGMITIFIVIGQSFVDSGFTQALIRKKNCTAEDYSTVFYFNLLVSVIFYVILFLSAGYIAAFFNQNQLTEITRVISISIVLNAFGLVQQAQMTKNLQIKIQTKISITANIASGIVAILMAYTGYGVWSLVIRNLTNILARNLLIWYYNKWRPILVFSIESFKEMFNFGSKLLFTGLLNRIFENLYYFVIGKYFSAQQLGFYTRAESFAQLPSTNIYSVINRVSYPILAKIQDDNIQLKNYIKKLSIVTMYISFFFMFIFIISAEELVITVLGTKWIQSAEYLRLLCIVYIFYPVQVLNLNLIDVKGYSNITLKLAFMKKALILPIIYIGIIYGIRIMILGMIINTLFSFSLNAIYAGKLVNFSLREQIIDILPIFSLNIIIGLIVELSSKILPDDVYLLLFFKILLYLILMIILSELLSIKGYKYLKEIIKQRVAN